MTTSPDTCNKCGARLYIRKTPRDCIECGAKCTGRRIRCDPCHQRHYLDRHRETTRRNREKKRARGEPLYVRKTPRDCMECGAKCTGRRTRCDPCHQRHYRTYYRDAMRIRRARKKLTDTETTT